MQIDFKINYYLCDENVFLMHKNNIYNNFNSRQPLKLKILETAIELFKKNGIKSIRMDDIAANLSISKRTLYEIYSNKEVLLLECIKHNDKLIADDLMEYAEKAENEIDIIVHFMKNRMHDWDSINHAFFIDIHKYPTVVEYIQAAHATRHEHSTDFFNRGVEHGFFVHSFNFEIIQKIFDITMQHVIETEMYKNFSLKEIFQNLVLLTLRGCCTEKGLKQLDRMLEEQWETE